MTGESKRSLLMVVHAYYPLAEPRVERQAKAAVAAGWSVEVLCLRGEGEPARETVEGVRVRRLPLGHARGAGFARVLLEYVAFTLMTAAVLAFWRPRPDVAQVHAPPDFLVAGALPLKLRGSKLVVDIHDLSPHMFQARFAPGLRMRLVVATLRAIERAACAVADEVVTVHEPYRGEIVADGVDERKVTVVMNSADEALIERVRASAPARPAGPGPFTLSYHGTITHWYGVDLVVEALARLGESAPDARAVILGEGDALEAARARATELGVASRVEFSGRYLPIDEALRTVAAASCGIIPNRPSTLNRFALSSKLFEYVALGIPAVVSRLETLEAHFSDDEVTFFEPGDADSLTDALAWVAANPEAAAEKVARAQAHAAQFSWRVNAERYLAAIAPDGDGALSAAPRTLDTTARG
jgi:glycosyltransferase involved in cell wall biosynthesis